MARGPQVALLHALLGVDIVGVLAVEVARELALEGGEVADLCPELREAHDAHGKGEHRDDDEARGAVGHQRAVCQGEVGDQGRDHGDERHDVHHGEDLGVAVGLGDVPGMAHLGVVKIFAQGLFVDCHVYSLSLVCVGHHITRCGRPPARSVVCQ